MDNQNDFTYDKENYKGLPAFVKELHDKGMHYIPLIDPGVSASEKPGTYPPYDEGISMDIFVKNSSGQLFIGKVSNVQNTTLKNFMTHIRKQFSGNILKVVLLKSSFTFTHKQN